MTRDEARERLNSLNSMIRTAVLLIKTEHETLDRFLDEARSADSILPILDPTLWMNPERRRAEAVLKPVYEAAAALLTAHEQAAAQFAAWPAP